MLWKIFQHYSLSLAILFFAGCKLAEDSKSDIKIVGGSVINDPASEILLATAILSSKKDEGCSATIIGPRHAVTAAHCFDKGFNDQVQLKLGTKGNIVLSQRIIHYAIHPWYVKGNRAKLGHADIAVIHFEPLPGVNYKPARVGSSQQVAPQAAIMIAGYGTTADGLDDFGNLKAANTSISHVSPQHREFLQIHGQGTGTCTGDSGGPVFIRDENSELRLVGVTSRGELDCNSGNGLYTDATRFQGWMKCVFQIAGVPLWGLVDDESSKECQSQPNNHPQTAAQSPQQPPPFFNPQVPQLNLPQPLIGQHGGWNTLSPVLNYYDSSQPMPNIAGDFDPTGIDPQLGRLIQNFLKNIH